MPSSMIEQAKVNGSEVALPAASGMESDVCVSREDVTSCEVLSDRNSISQVRQNARHEGAKLTSAGSLKRKPISRPEMAFISSSVSFSFALSRFSRICCSVLLFGMTASPRCVAHLSTTCAGVAPCASAMDVIIGWAKSGCARSDLGVLSSRKPSGPKDEYAVTSIPCDLAYCTARSCKLYG